jgi:hypothetical protein
MNADVEKAVRVVRTALNDWTAIYASEFCDEDAVAAARQRISDEGTLGYICNAQGAVDKIIQHLRDQEAEIARLRGVADRIPTNWLDPMLTGPSAVLKGYDYKGPDIERLLNAIRARITAHLGGEHE